MKTGFKQTNAIKNQKPEDKPKQGKPYHLGWDFRCPQYDERSSCYVNTGTHYGVGMKQPVGNTGNPKERAPTLPFGRVNTMEVDEKG